MTLVNARACVFERDCDKGWAKREKGRDTDAKSRAHTDMSGKNKPKTHLRYATLVRVALFT